MLVLSRREGESLTIIGPDGQQITLTAVAIGPVHQGKAARVVRLGIDAPPDYRIARTELLQEGEFRKKVK